MNQKFVFNGREYSSVDEMPVEIRRQYQTVIGSLVDHNQDGIPDALENRFIGGANRTMRITINGQTFNSPDEMPPEMRQKYDRAMAALPDENHDGIPDILQGRQAGQVQTQVHTTTSIKIGSGSVAINKTFKCSFGAILKLLIALAIACGVALLILQWLKWMETSD